MLRDVNNKQRAFLANPNMAQARELLLTVGPAVLLIAAAFFLATRFMPPPPLNARNDPRDSRDSLYSRLSLIDANGRTVLAGNPAPDPQALRRPIDSASKIVGYLALSPLQGIGSQADAALLNHRGCITGQDDDLDRVELIFDVTQHREAV